jgi:tellurite resistance protein TerC
MDAVLLQLAETQTTALRPWVYAGFIAMVLAFLALDLGVFHRKPKAIRTGEALAWTAAWATCALLFTGLVYFMYEGNWLGIGLNVPQLDGSVAPSVDGLEAAEQFITGYAVEYSLSMDNVFVIAMIFAHFRVPAEHQHRVLFWGILGALAMRGAMIAAGVALISRFSWTTYIFGAFLLATAARMALRPPTHADPAQGLLARMFRRVYPVAPDYDGQHFFTICDGRRAATPLLLTLIVIECTDLIFALDSIPAIFAITADPFIVFTSNVFAILGLRSLYFSLAAMIDRFRYLKPSLIAVLAFVGVKLLLVKTAWKIDTGLSLLVVLGILGAGVAASMLIPANRRPRATPEQSP